MTDSVIFYKGHGLGNDYLALELASLPFSLTPPAVRLLCDRNHGVGSDGILAEVPSASADFGLRIFNPDGSEAEKSGNGIRIFGKFLFDHGFTTSDRFTVGTLGGPVHLTLQVDEGRVNMLTANMGKATFDD